MRTLRETICSPSPTGSYHSDWSDDFPSAGEKPLALPALNRALVALLNLTFRTPAPTSRLQCPNFQRKPLEHDMVGKESLSMHYMITPSISRKWKRFGERSL